jgi:uncharacterized protein YdiU (UPF0061 family)
MVLPFQINNTFTNTLPADTETENFVRQVHNACFSWVQPTPCKNPVLIHASKDLAKLLGIPYDTLAQEDFLQLMSGNKVLDNTKPFAMCYGGHQFGTWAGQLGDGRAINLFEIDVDQKQYTLQLKGAGPTPYSRSADGYAVLRSSIREYLCSEAMYHLGIPTTRALSLVATGAEVLRDVLYDGNPTYEPGAIVCRVAPTFIRFGNFQILAAQANIDLLQKLTDYTIAHFYHHLIDDANKYVAFLAEVAERTIDMVIHWERVGFVHGVMNTDNMSILGETIDYGPYGWLENYDPNWTPNTTDAQGKRYRFGNQANIAIWNIYQLANALVPIIKDVPTIETTLKQIVATYAPKHYTMQLKKLGLVHLTEASKQLIHSLKQLMLESEIDYILFYRKLASFCGSTAWVNTLAECCYNPLHESLQKRWETWLTAYWSIVCNEENSQRVEIMQSTNPKYVLRNYMAQMAIDQASAGNYQLINELNTLLLNPYNEQPDMEKWFTKRPTWALHKVGCSMLSCSS